MTRVVDIVLLALTLPFALPALVLFFQLATAALGPNFRSPSRATVAAEPGSLRFAVLMPAHDEAETIVAAIRAVLAQCGPGDRLLVVADNCSDATAAVARAAGAEVVERDDPSRRGKGYALDHGVRWLERDPPAAVIVVDADCIVGSGALPALARSCVAAGRPVQALYLMHAPPGAGVGLHIAAFAWLVKNKWRPRGYAAWGLPCPLMGTGMAFPWTVLRDAPLASGHLVEDMRLGLDLAAAGRPPLFCEAAAVASVFPTDAAAVTSQRTRWEHGHLSVIAASALPMLRTALVRHDPRLTAMAFDLLVPPLASLVLVLSLVLCIDSLAWAAGAAPWAAAVACAAWLLVFAGVALAWVVDGRRIVSARDLLALPLYIVAKVPVYVRLFTKRQVDWVRTRRDHPGHR